MIAGITTLCGALPSFAAPDPEKAGPLLNFPLTEYQIRSSKTSPEEPNFGLNQYPTRFHITDAGPFTGTYELAGGLDGFAALQAAASPTRSGSPGAPLSVSLEEAVVTFQKTTGEFQFTYWGGAWQTPAQGIASNAGPFNSLASFGTAAHPFPNRPTFKWWVTWKPSRYFSISGGEMHSLMGTEVGFDYYNPTPLVSELNNMQATTAYGPELHFYAGPAILSVQFSDAYHTGRINYLSASLLYNLNGDDYLLAFGGENTGRTGVPGPGFARANSSLIGAGAQFIFGRWLFSPEAEVQWLPRNAVPVGSSHPRPATTYYNVAAMADVVYQFSEQWSLAVQAQYVFQNNDPADPNAEIFGNWLQAGVPAAPGVFSPGSSLAGFQLVPTWQHRRMFVRGDLSYVHLSGFDAGTGFGARGNASSHLAALMEVGFLL